MSKYLSIIYIYNRASFQRLILILTAIPLSLACLFLCRAGTPAKGFDFMLLERGFGGMWGVLILIGAMLCVVLTVTNSLNGRKDQKATHATPGYTLRRMHASPIACYLTLFSYYLGIVLIVLAVALVSVYLIGKVWLLAAGATEIDTKLALGLLRTEIGHAILPLAHPSVLIFNIAAVAALAGECAKSSYLTWHNGAPSAGAALILIAAFYIWACNPENTFILMTTLFVILYAGLSLMDVFYREKRPKGDPFKVNKYVGIMDMNSTDFDDELYLEVNSPVEEYSSKEGTDAISRYGRAETQGKRKWLKAVNPFWLRRRFMPLGSNLEKANTFFGVWVFLGFAEHLLLFYGRYQTQLKEIESHIKGVTIDSGLKMPYFWELQDYTYVGYLLGIIMVFFIQAYWNYAYYNKETNSVFVMKRLPNRKEYPRTIWVAPLMQSILIFAMMILHTAVDFCLYAAAPDIALPEDYLLHILPF